VFPLARCVVTGGAGFIGSNLVHRLLCEGHQVAVIENLATGKRENLLGVEDSVEFILGDIRDLDLLLRVLRGSEVVYHQAALPSVPRSVQDPASTNETNVTGTLHVLLAARDSEVRRVVLASSSSVYGNTQVLPKKEDMPAEPLSPYAVSKYTNELYARVFSRMYGLETVCLRYFNVFGPRQDPQSQYAAVIPKFISAALHGDRPVIFGDGEQSRDFTYVDNVVEANMLAATAEEVSGEVFNIGCGSSYSLNQLVASLSEILGTAIVPEHRPQRPGDVRHSLASIERARIRLCYEPSVTFADGLRRAVEWFRDCSRGPSSA